MFLVQLARWIVMTLPLQGVWRDRRAVTSIEYVIIAIIIATAIMGGLSRVGGYLGTDFNNVSSEL
jgi:Flp pilus assembly pilin Flp